MRNNIFTGIMFNGKHSWHDYGLYLNRPPDYGTPEPQTITLDIPGMNGVLDYTEAITGDVTYSNRSQKYTFITEVGRWEREALKAEIMNDLHGKRVEVVPDEDSNWYYEGRASVSFSDIDRWRMKVNIEVDAAPFKLAQDETELIVHPEDMHVGQAVSFGKGTAYTGTNSAWIFGSESQADYDFSGFLRFNFAWIDAPRQPSAIIQLNDTYGHVYNKNVSITGPTGEETIALDDIGDVDPSAIWRILVSGIGQVELWAVPSGATYSTILHNDRMPVVPTWYSSFANDIQVVLNGYGATISPGMNYVPELYMGQGEYTLYIYSVAATGSLVVTYREGRL